jgi:hypothetical protein
MAEHSKENKYINECTLALTSDSKLDIKCSIITHCDDDKISLRKAESDDSDSGTLVLDLDIKEGESPIVAKPRYYSYTEQGEHVKGYKKVAIRYNGEVCSTIDVE